MSVSGGGYSPYGGRRTTASGDGETTIDRQPAYAYMRKHLLMDELEVVNTKQRLAYFADQSGYELAAIFIEEIQTWPVAFERLLQAVIRDNVEVVILPSMLHFAVLGAPNNVKKYFESAAEARVVTAFDAVSDCPGEAVS